MFALGWGPTALPQGLLHLPVASYKLCTVSRWIVEIVFTVLRISRIWVYDTIFQSAKKIIAKAA